MSRLIHKIPPWLQLGLLFLSLVMSGYVWASNTFVTKDTMAVVMVYLKSIDDNVKALQRDRQ